MGQPSGMDIGTHDPISNPECAFLGSAPDFVAAMQVPAEKVAGRDSPLATPSQPPCSSPRHGLTVVRIALAFENLTPIQVCQAFSRALDRPCTYVFSPTIDIRVSIPPGYREQLAGIEVLFGQMNVPYFPGDEFDYNTPQPSGKGKGRQKEGMSRLRRLTQEARELWPGYRGIEEYAREVFPVEEEANGKTWMKGGNMDKVVNT
jgi:hypothetical protein